MAWHRSSLREIGGLGAASAPRVAGAVGRVIGADVIADALWLVAASVGALIVVRSVIAGLRRRRPGVDVIALLALAGAVAIGEHAAAAMVSVMLATGQLLEARASRRAERELSALVARIPTVAHCRTGDGHFVDVPISQIGPGDVLVVRPGEIVPIDGRVVEGAAVLDESAVTGEPMPVTAVEHAFVASGVTNIGTPVVLRAVATAAESTYAGIVRLVEQAEAGSAPFVRLADRYALAFVPFTMLVAALAWVGSGSFTRAVAVLVVATPCPLILAAPVAIVSGLSRASRRGVIIKGGGVLERLGQAEVLVFDKTGTVTVGRPELIDVATAPGFTPGPVLMLAASVEQGSAHVLASSIVDAATSEGLALSWPAELEEVVGMGLGGQVDGVAVRTGRLEWLVPPPADGSADVAPWIRAVRRRVLTDGVMTVFVEVDGVVAGALILEDPIRPDASRTMRELRRHGFRRLVMASGDRALVAEAVGFGVGADEVLASCTPQAKVEAVQRERSHGVTIMVGDGINDAPALAIADIGVALGARGTTASSEAADVVLTVDRIDRLLEGVLIARRSHRIARQSVVLGMGLAGLAMAAAAAGLLSPFAGAVTQEVIDVVAIANALRAGWGGIRDVRRLHGDDAVLSRRFETEHRSLAGGLRLLRTVADELDRVPLDQAREDLRTLVTFLRDDLLPHELAEDRQLYPAVARVVGGHDPTAPMSRAHREIAHEVAVVEGLADALGDADATDETGADIVRELQRVLHGLDAVLRLHFAQEEQEYLSLAEDAPA